MHARIHQISLYRCTLLIVSGLQLNAVDICVIRWRWNLKQAVEAAQDEAKRNSGSVNAALSANAVAAVAADTQTSTQTMRGTADTRGTSSGRSSYDASPSSSSDSQESSSAAVALPGIHGDVIKSLSTLTARWVLLPAAAAQARVLSHPTKLLC